MEDIWKVLLWSIIALAIDFGIVSPIWNWAVSLSSPKFSTWNPAVYALYMYLIPFGASNFLELLAYASLKEKNIL